MATLRLEIVTPERLAYSDDVESVVLPAVEGEIGVLPMHIPLMTQIKPGELVVSKGGTKHFLAVGEGFVSVDQTSVKVLTDMALESEHIDESAAEDAVQRAQAAMARKDLGGEEAAAVQAALAKSIAQLHVKRRRRSA
ncbi:MAG: ATP synthase F1 subunit epsilon [Verrucomicrobiota bacterium]|nr:ATP synthase F1 subunit epsilon [Verrucomicrobiota bacterium]